MRNRCLVLMVLTTCFNPSVFGQLTQVGSNILGEAIGDESGVWSCLSDDGQTVLIGGVYNDGLTLGELSGWALALSDDGHALVLGSSRYSQDVSFGGCARIYECNGASWLQKGVTLSGTISGEYLGNSVNIGANCNVRGLGAPHLNRTSGKVNVYQLTLREK